VLDLAILGLLKEQPLHGYELKKRLNETLGFLGGVSFGSLYPALRRLQRGDAIETVEPELDAGPMPPTGSVSGEAAVARGRGRRPRAGRRIRKAYRITHLGEARFAELLGADGDARGDDGERAFALKLAFCGHMSPPARMDLLERRRADLSDRLATASSRPDGTDRYRRSLVEHRAAAVVHDLEWIDELIAAERELSRHTEGVTR
jgi:DNA-binding PadR family transcriptional regulator